MSATAPPPPAPPPPAPRPTASTTGAGAPAAPRRRLQRVAWLLVLVAGALAYVVVLRVMVSTRNLTFFPSLLLIGSITVPVAVLAFAEVGGRRSSLVASVRPWVVATTAIGGGVVGTVAAGVLEYQTLVTLGVLPMILVGVIEEGAKLVVPLVVFLLWRQQDPRGGVIVGIAAGTGFAVLETMGYGFQALLKAGSISAVDSTLLLRALLSPAGHIAWTGLTVAALWRLRGARRPGRAAWTFVGAYVLAVGLHAAWDGIPGLVSHVVVAVVSLTLLLVLIHRAHRVPARAALTGAAGPPGGLAG